jgi:hypothetical protein
MKQQDAYKLLAALMILIMIIVPVAYMVTSPRDEQETQTNQSQTEKYNQELWVFNSPFDSISDALNITPPGAESATFVDLDGMPPQMIQWVKQYMQILGEVDRLYKSNTTKMYYANLHEGKNNSFLLLSTMYPEKNDFEYVEIPNSYPPILRRTDMNGTYNVMGRPAILAPGDTIVKVISISESLNRTYTSYDQYENLLNKVPDAPFQTLSSNVSFAKQYYEGIRFTNGSYERTTAYLNVNSNTMKNLTRSKANSTQHGFTDYNITKDGNYTIVKILGHELFSIISEVSS